MSLSNGEYVKTTYELELPDGSIGQNVWYHRANLTAAQGNAAVVTALDLWLETLMGYVAGRMSNQCTGRTCQFDKVAWDAGEGDWYVSERIGSSIPTVSYSAANDPLPNQVAPTIQFRTSRPKSFGRKFLMGFVEDETDGSFLESAAVTAIANLATYALDDVVISGGNVLEPIILRVGVQVALDLLSYVVTDIVGTQRRRRPTVGE